MKRALAGRLSEGVWFANPRNLTQGRLTMGGRKLWAVAALLLVSALLLAGCGAQKQTETSASPAVTAAPSLAPTTAPGTQPVEAIVWALYRDTYTLDPIQLFDYPENTPATLLYESLLRQAPDGSIGPGVATMSQPDPLTLVFTLDQGATFWDGNPVTPEDVVFSLERQRDPELGGFYGATLSRVKTITATGADQVTLALSEPDYWLPGELSSIAGIVMEKSFTEQQGKDYGTPAGKVMGTGAYMLDSWTPGAGVVVVVNPDYWNADVKPLVKKITLKGVPASSSLSSGLETGGINGMYLNDVSMLTQLEKSSALTVYKGPSWVTDAMVICNLKGTLGDVRVRQALSLALDRKGIISAVHRGAAEMPRWLSNPGTFGYAKDVFDAAYQSSPILEQDLEKAKALIQEAGAEGQPLTIGMTTEVAGIAGISEAYRAAALAIGLKPKFKAVSAQNYGYFFTDPKAREGVDCFNTLNYGDYADPAALLATVVLPDGSQNFSGYDNPEMVALLDEARGTADPDQRAELVSQAQQMAAEDLPWIPDAQPLNCTVVSKSLSGMVVSFAYMFAPWADQLGGNGQ